MAAAGINTQYIQGYANSIVGVINGILVPVLIAIAFLVFLWGIYNRFIKGANDPKAFEIGRTLTLYGVIGFVIIFSVWSIVWIFMATLGLSTDTSPTPPTIGNSSFNASPPSNISPTSPGSHNIVEGGFCNNSAFFCGAGLTCDFTKPDPTFGGGTCVK